MRHHDDVAREQVAAQLLASARVSVDVMTDDGVAAWVEACAARELSDDRKAIVASLTLADFRAAAARRVEHASASAPRPIRRHLLRNAHRIRLGRSVRRPAVACASRRTGSGRAPRGRRTTRAGASRGSPGRSTDDPEPEPPVGLRRRPEAVVRVPLEGDPRLELHADSYEDEQRLRAALPAAVAGLLREAA